jgi:hypothetical protein
MEKQEADRWYWFDRGVAARVEPQRFEQVLGAIRCEYVAARRAHLEGELRALHSGSVPGKPVAPAKPKPAKAAPARRRAWPTR